MKHFIASLLIAATLAIPGTALAYRGHGGGYGRGHHHGSDVALGIVGGIIGGVILDRVLLPPAVVYEPAYPRYRAPRVYAPYPAYTYERAPRWNEYRTAPRYSGGCREARYSRDYYDYR